MWKAIQIGHNEKRRTWTIQRPNAKKEWTTGDERLYVQAKTCHIDKLSSILETSHSRWGTKIGWTNGKFAKDPPKK